MSKSLENDTAKSSAKDVVVAPIPTGEGETVRVIADGGGAVLPRPSGEVDPLTRPVLVGRIGIASFDERDSPVVAPNDVFKNWLGSPLVQDRLRGYKWIRGDLLITCLLSAPGGSYGSYVLQAICEGGMTDSCDSRKWCDMDQYDSVITSMQDTYVVLNCEAQNGGEMTLPFVNRYPYVSVDPDEHVFPMWRVLLWPLVPVASTTMPTSVGTVLIYASVQPGYSLETRVLQGDGDPPSSTTPVSRRSTVLTPLRQLLPNMYANLARVPKPEMAPSLFSANYATDPVMPTTNVVHEVSSGGTGVVFDTHGAQVSSGARGDPYFFKRWTVHSEFSIQSSSPVGVLFRVPVTPSYYVSRRGVEYHNTAGYVGLPYHYWRGGVEYGIYIPSAATIHGNLQVIYSPTLGVDVSDVDPTQWGVGTSIELSGTQFKVVRVPYDQALGPKENVCATVGDVLPPQCVNGELLFNLTSPLVCPKDGASLTVVILIRGSDDLSFSGYKHYGRVPGGGICPWRSTLVFNAGGAQAIDSTSTTDVTTMGGGVAPTSMSLPSLFSASLAHSSHVGSIVVKKGDVSQNLGVFWVRLPTALGVGSASLLANSNVAPQQCVVAGTTWTWFGHYTAPFTGVACQMDMLLVSRTPGVIRVRITRFSSAEFTSFQDSSGQIALSTFGGGGDSETAAVDTTVVNLTQHTAYTDVGGGLDGSVFHTPLSKQFSSKERDRDGRLTEFAGEYARVEVDPGCLPVDGCELRLDVYTRVRGAVGFMHFRRVPGITRRGGDGYVIVQKA